jgi:hypothetical protein
MAEFQLSTDYGVRGDQLIDEIDNGVGLSLTTNDMSFSPPRTLRIDKVPAQLVEAVRVLVSNHVPQALYFDADYERQQADRIGELVRDALAGLGRVDNLVDFGYAYAARLLAKANGASDPEVLAIVDRATAEAYITSMSQWSALPVAMRQWLAVDLVSRAYDAMAIRLLLVD